MKFMFVCDDLFFNNITCCLNRELLWISIFLNLFFVSVFSIRFFLWFSALSFFFWFLVFFCADSSRILCGLPFLFGFLSFKISNLSLYNGNEISLGCLFLKFS
jgi:hypothetical protein